MVGTSNHSVPYKVWGVTHNGASAIEEFPRNIDSSLPRKICRTTSSPVHNLVHNLVQSTWFNRRSFSPKKILWLKTTNQHNQTWQNDRSKFTMDHPPKGLTGPPNLSQWTAPITVYQPQKRSITPGNTYLFGDCYNRLKPILIHFSKCISQK
jgi:hypothetical protein